MSILKEEYGGMKLLTRRGQVIRAAVVMGASAVGALVGAGILAHNIDAARPQIVNSVRSIINNSTYGLLQSLNRQ